MTEDDGSRRRGPGDSSLVASGLLHLSGDSGRTGGLAGGSQEPRGGGQDLADAKDLDGALGVLAEAAASSAGATLAVIRVAERGSEGLHARGVWAASPALRAELEGSRLAEGKSDRRI